MYRMTTLRHAGNLALMVSPIILSISCGSTTHDQSRDLKGGVHEAMLRDLLTRGVHASVQRQPEVLCVGLDAPLRFLEVRDTATMIAPPDLDQLVDPGSRLLARLHEADRRVRPTSACEHNAATAHRGLVYAKDGHTRGLILWSRDVAFSSDSLATARGGYYEDGLSSAEWLCRLQRDGAAWRVADSKMQWIS